MIILTKKAVKEVCKIMAEQEIETDKHFLRVGVKGGGCSGLNFSLDITESKSEKDYEWQHEGFSVICDPKSYIYLKGTEVDFKDEVMGRGFVFDCPSAKTKCGCGSSFSV